jgi:hypothetical protein
LSFGLRVDSTPAAPDALIDKLNAILKDNDAPFKLGRG